MTVWHELYGIGNLCHEKAIGPASKMEPVSASRISQTGH